MKLGLVVYEVMFYELVVHSVQGQSESETLHPHHAGSDGATDYTQLPPSDNWPSYRRYQQIPPCPDMALKLAHASLDLNHGG